jgi:hypothetical protein
MVRVLLVVPKKEKYPPISIENRFSLQATYNMAISKTTVCLLSHLNKQLIFYIVNHLIIKNLVK